MIVYLTSGDQRDAEFSPLVTAAGITPEHERSAWGDPEVTTWGIQDAPVLLWLHDGRAVYQVTDANPDALATFTADAQTAVDAYELAKAEAQEPAE